MRHFPVRPEVSAVSFKQISFKINYYRTPQNVRDEAADANATPFMKLLVNDKEKILNGYICSIVIIHLSGIHLSAKNYVTLLPIASSQPLENKFISFFLLQFQQINNVLAVSAANACHRAILIGIREDL